MSQEEWTLALKEMGDLGFFVLFIVAPLLPVLLLLALKNKTNLFFNIIYPIFVSLYFWGWFLNLPLIFNHVFQQYVMYKYYFIFQESSYTFLGGGFLSGLFLVIGLKNKNVNSIWLFVLGVLIIGAIDFYGMAALLYMLW